MIMRGHVFSQKLEMETCLTIVAPTSSLLEKPFKVVYLLHGVCGRSGDWVDYTMLPTYAGQCDIVFILPEAARSFYADMVNGQKYFSYITEELPRICQRLFHISTVREDTAVMGASMGGYGALKAALTYPEHYGYCYAISSACLFIREFLEEHAPLGVAHVRSLLGDQLTNDFQAAFGESLKPNQGDDLLDLAKRIDPKEIRPQIHMFCGKEDGFLNLNRRFSRELDALGFNSIYEEWEGQHDWYFFDQALRKSLEAFTQSSARS